MGPLVGCYCRSFVNNGGRVFTGVTGQFSGVGGSVGTIGLAGRVRGAGYIPLGKFANVGFPFGELGGGYGGGGAAGVMP